MDNNNKNDKDIVSLMNGGVVVVQPKDRENRIVPLFCPCCNFPMKTSDDSAAYKKHKCCAKCECHQMYEYSKEEDSNKWKRYMEMRLLYSKSIVNFR